VFSTPAVAGDLLYVGSCGGSFYALDPREGSVRWSYDTSRDGPAAQFHGDPLITDELVVAPADGQALARVYAFDRKSGVVRWQRPFEGGVPGDLLRTGETIYALTMRGDLVALDLATGALQWTFSGGARNADRPPGSPAMAGDRVVFTSRSGGVYAVATATGRLLWKRELGGDLNTSVSVVGDGVYVGSMKGTAYLLKVGSGEIEASFDAGAPLFGNLIPTASGILALAAPGALLHIETGLRAARWRWQGPSQWSSFRPLLWDGLVLLGNEARELVAIRLDDGTEAWRIPAAGVLRGLGLSPNGGTLFVGTLAGKVQALPLATFRPRLEPAVAPDR
jgi:outer membrane protein assembly factor BamB